LRWILGQCTSAHIETELDRTGASFYARIARKEDQKAIVAASAKLLKIVCWVLKEKGVYRNQGMRPYQAL